MDELEHDLQSLTRMSPPTTPELGADVLVQRATRARRRSQLAIAVPAAALVMIVLLAVVVFQSRWTSDVLAGDQVTTGTLPGLTARELELLDFVAAETELRHQLHLEMLWTATYAATVGTAGDAGLAAQRTATDRALAAYESKRDHVQPGRDSQPVADALKIADIRLRSLRTVRNSVNGIWTDAIRLIDNYTATARDLASTERSLVATTDSPAFFRPLLAKSDLAGVTDQEAHTAALLLIPVEIGFYAAVLPTASQSVAQKNNSLGQGCGNDALAGGDNCMIYRDVIGSNNDLSQTRVRFQEFATGEQKRRLRLSDAGLRFDELKRLAIEDGRGRNDLTGAELGSISLKPEEFREAAIERINRLFEVEVALLEIVRVPRPVPSKPDGATGTTTTLSATSTTIPASTTSLPR